MHNPCMGPWKVSIKQMRRDGVGWRRGGGDKEDMKLNEVVQINLTQTNKTEG